MRIYRHYDGLNAEHRGGVVAIGNFDGVHRGHRAVIAEAGRIAAKIGAPWGVLTFEPHPRSVFNPATPPFRITPFHLKSRLVQELGARFLVVLHFDLEFSRRSAEDFVTEVLVGNLAARHVVFGYDFVFGHQRRGTAQFLEAQGRAHGFGTTGIDQVVDESGEVVSSTRIRACLAEGRPRDAARLLGRPFAIEGRVVPGDRRGRNLGFPTANVMLETTTFPLFGVYAVRAGMDEGADIVWHDGVANLGYRPTFGGTTPVLETFIFDFAGDIYGRHLRVALVDFLRPERKFDGVAQLMAQIKGDCEEARRRLAKPPAAE